MIIIVKNFLMLNHSSSSSVDESVFLDVTRMSLYFLERVERTLCASGCIRVSLRAVSRFVKWLKLACMYSFSCVSVSSIPSSCRMPSDPMP